MTLNLISDPWIPVRLRDGSEETIAPHQMTEPDIVEPNWPRVDLNLACYELLIGLVLLADPPVDITDWRMRKKSSSEALKRALEPFTPAFFLFGDYPFLQEKIEESEQPKPVDVLFIDSAGNNAVKKNSDLMTWRGRYNVLDPALAAMALYTLQAFAPAGGSGYRTSMRGGGPMITLIDPRQSLWSLIWANVPYGTAAAVENLPWMRPLRTSQATASETYPRHCHPVEAFFGMPRRLRLVMDGHGVTGVIQKPYGTNYAGWRHPTSPYYRQKEGSELLPVHPKPGHFGYRNWVGIVEVDRSGLWERARCVETWKQGRDSSGPESGLRVAGWAMSNMMPVTFLNSVEPLITLPEGRDLVLYEMIGAADKVAKILRSALRSVVVQGTVRDSVVDEFYIRTEQQFHESIANLKAAVLPHRFVEHWINALRSAALYLFDQYSVPDLDLRLPKQQKQIIKARLSLLAVQPEKFAEFRETVAMIEGEDE